MPPDKAQSNTLAIIALVLGALAFCLAYTGILGFILAVPAVICGIVALTKKQHKGMGITSVVLGSIALVESVLLMALLAGFFANDSTHTIKQNNASSTHTNSEWDMDAAFARIKTGMTKTDVENVTSKKSEDCAIDQNPTMGKYEYCNYGDIDKDKGFIAVTYHDDKVARKTKTLY